MISGNPASLQRDAAAAADKAWLKAGDYSGMFQSLTMPVTVYVCGSHDILREKFKAIHKTVVPDAVGEEYFWASAGSTIESARVELWIVAKRTNAGWGIINKWAGGHGLMRLIDLGVRLVTGKRFGDAGNTDKPEYFE